MTGHDRPADSMRCRRFLGASLPLVAMLGLFATTCAHGAEPLMMTVEYGDCATVLDGPVCVRPADDILHLWVATQPGARITLRTDRRPADVLASIEVENGNRYQIRLPQSANRITVVAQKGASSTRWQLALASEDKPVDLQAVRKLANAGETDAAVALAQRVLAGDPQRRGSLLGLLGRLHLRLDNVEAARVRLQQAIAENSAQGRRLEALRDTNVLAFLLMHKDRRFDQISALYARFAGDPAAPAEAHFFTTYYQGLAALNSGDARIALRQLDAAAAQARRMGWDRRALDADQQLAEQLLQLGRQREGYDLLAAWQERGLPPALRPCERANFLTNVGWTALFVSQSGASVEDPTQTLTRAQTIYEAQCSPNDRLNGGINLALAHVQAGRLAAARAALTSARQATDAPELRLLLWWLDVDAQVALAHGRHAEALASYRKLQRLAEATLSPSARWRAAVGRARALQVSGEAEAALAAWAEADHRLDRDLARVPVDAGRATLAGARGSALRGQLELLLDLDRVSEALALARRSRSRVLAPLRSTQNGQSSAERRAAADAYRALRKQLGEAAGNAWSLPVTELEQLRADRTRSERILRELLDAASDPSAYQAAGGLTPVPPGELLLVLHPLTRGWAVLADDGTDVYAHRPACEETSVQRLAACLLAPLQTHIEQASRLRLLPAGRLQLVDFHALTVGDEVLLGHAPVTYGLDVGGPQATAPAAPHALLVADARGNLAHARREVATVEQILAATGQWSVAKLQGRVADSVAVVQAMERADLFHYAGHAEYAGVRGWNSQLGLARGTTMSVTDVLMLARAPRFVVLSGCETARSAVVAPVQSIGLANAFLARGSDAVLAAVRPVSDEVAYRLMDEFYRSWATLQPPSEALRIAQLELRETMPDSDWAAFRLIERM